MVEVQAWRNNQIVYKTLENGFEYWPEEYKDFLNKDRQFAEDPNCDETGESLEKAAFPPREYYEATNQTLPRLFLWDQDGIERPENLPKFSGDRIELRYHT